MLHDITHQEEIHGKMMRMIAVNEKNISDIFE